MIALGVFLIGVSAGILVGFVLSGVLRPAPDPTPPIPLSALNPEIQRQAREYHALWEEPITFAWLPGEDVSRPVDPTR